MIRATSRQASSSGLLVLVILMFGVTLAGCSWGAESDEASNSAQNDPPPRGDSLAGAANGALTIWVDDETQPVFELLGPSFRTHTGFALNLEVVPSGEIRNRLREAAGAGAGPDLFVGRHWWTGQLVADQLIVPPPLRDLSDSLTSAALDGATHGSQLYSLPFAASTPLLYHNSQYGPTAPETFAELLARCEQLSADVRCLTMAGGDAPGDVFFSSAVLSAFGGYFFGSHPGVGPIRSDVGVAEPEFARGVTLLAELDVDGGPTNESGGPPWQGFVDGLSAFYIGSPNEYGEVYAFMEADFSVAPVPAFESETSGSRIGHPFVEFDTVFLASRSENKAVATVFLEDFLASDEAMAAFQRQTPRGSPWLAQISSTAPGTPANVFNDAGIAATPIPSFGAAETIWEPVGGVLTGVRTGSTAPGDALAEIQQIVEKALGVTLGVNPGEG